MNSRPATWRILPTGTGSCPAELRPALLAGIPAHLPGSVHQSLLRASLIPDPFYGLNAEELGWIEELHWVLEIPLVYTPSAAPVPARLILDGVDTYATVFLNGTPLGATNNAFLRYELPTNGALREGENLLRLDFQPIAESVPSTPGRYNMAFYNQHRVHVRRMQCTFGWDWVSQFITFGLLYAPRLVDRPEIVFPGVLTAGVTADSATMQARWDVGSLPDGAPAEVGIAIQSPQGKLLATLTAPIRQGLIEFTLRDPELWQPIGYGAQPLYRATFKPLPAGEEVSVVFGIRAVELLVTFDAEGSPEAALTAELAAHLNQPLVPGREFGFRVNGADIFCLGGNWVPCDPFPGPETEARKVQILRQFAQSGGNTIRVWGGGIYETPLFYDTCAKLGILVLQDFMMACADYPADDPAFLAKLEPEIDQAVRRLRGNTAIIHWYGDNENAMSDGEHAPGQAWFKIFQNITRPALERHDLGRSFTASCPFFGTPSTNALQGDSHISAFMTEDRGFLLGNMRDYKELVDRTISRFLSEYAIFGAPDVESLRRFLPADRLDDSALWEFHTKDNPSKPPGVTITLFQSVEAIANRLLGTPESPEDRLNKLAYAHYEATRLVVEAARRKQPFCRGLLFWMLNDCWPASGWSLIDYYARPKAGYHGFRHAAQPVHGSFRLVDGRLEAWISNNSREEVSRRFEVIFETWDGMQTILAAAQASLPAGASQRLLTVDPTQVPDPQAGVFHLADGWYFHGMPSEMKPPRARLSVETSPAGDGKLISRVTADSYARVVTLRGEAIAEENYFELRAGETRLIRVTPTAAPTGTPLFFKAWNSEATEIWPPPDPLSESRYGYFL